MISTILQVIVVFGVIAIGSRYTGIGLGIWGGIGLFLLVTVFGLRPTSAPVDVLLIMIAVATAASVMDAPRRGLHGSHRRKDQSAPIRIASSLWRLLSPGSLPFSQGRPTLRRA